MESLQMQIEDLSVFLKQHKPIFVPLDVVCDNLDNEDFFRALRAQHVALCGGCKEQD